MISGEVIDWSTGAPVPYTDVLLAEMNSSRIVARTDAHGQFVSVSSSPNLYFLYAGTPRFGRLLGVTFGAIVVKYRKGQRIRNVKVPPIPATELSGHVYDTDGRPIPAARFLQLPVEARIGTNPSISG